MKGNLSISDFCHNMKRFADNFKDVDSLINDQELVLQILNNLPDSYNSIIDVITNQCPFPKFDQARNMILLHEARDTHKTTPSPDSSVFLFSQNQRNSRSDNGCGRGRGGDGKEQTCKTVLQDIDEEKKQIVYKFNERDLLKLYKNYLATFHVETRGGVDFITWTIDYEPLNPDSPHVDVELLIEWTKQVEAHIFG
ncbi:hypothetical protein BUALT_Bualt04G0075100 [Buddleja alternifolia]|uniref:Bet v I/Major latex protein domain-containing protein n=1 Tax=Buddleja alternifolia TaxID=168488 RepID=A0AAV6XNE9_9LAMI|nr:hypothetical protein BUALT_Bualt04G0075100 [Buddleja alternifolia]